MHIPRGLAHREYYYRLFALGPFVAERCGNSAWCFFEPPAREIGVMGDLVKHTFARGPKTCEVLLRGSARRTFLFDQFLDVPRPQLPRCKHFVAVAVEIVVSDHGALGMLDAGLRDLHFDA